MAMPTAYICDAVRTPFGRYGGALARVRADDLAAVPLRALVSRHPAVDWQQLDDVLMGCANQAGEDNRNVARMAALLSGLPESVPASTINRLCGSSLDAIATAARAIVAGEAALVIAGGVESMSRAPFVFAKSDAPFARNVKIEDSTLGWRFVNPEMQRRYGIDSMAETAENVALAYAVSRGDQDAFALRSQQRAAAARQAGRLAQEIVPVDVAGKSATESVTTDEHLRPDTTAEGLGRLAPIVREDGTVTAGNASGINDGACAVIVASEAAARSHGLTPRARFVGASSAGVAPRLMGIGPVPATERLLSRTGVAMSEIGVIELNEAFAAQVLAVTRAFGLQDDAPEVNADGGAIALGHPLGASGARLVTAAVRRLSSGDARYALCTMCIGVGQGMSLLLERV